jgi:acyl-CoA thioesterase
MSRASYSMFAQDGTLLAMASQSVIVRFWNGT